jgi:hypothetical protein
MSSMTKRLEMDINNCLECPHSYYGSEHKPLEDDGELICRKLGRKVSSEIFAREEIDPGCPLPDKLHDNPMPSDII